MTEAEWLDCTDPDPLLDYLQHEGSNRKLRLFAVACALHLWGLLEDTHHEDVELAEQLAERNVIPEPRDWDFVFTELDAAAISTLQPEALAAARGTADYAAEAAGVSAAMEGQFAEHRPRILAARRAQADLLRDIFGNPFIDKVTNPFWLDWSGAIIPELAKPIYEERAFERLPILADALEEAGCTDAAILNHCRQPGEHVRGCWVLDLLLGKG
jgi:hypothetical protein